MTATLAPSVPVSAEDMPPVPALPPRCPICGAALPAGALCAPLCQLVINLDKRADTAATQSDQCPDLRMRYMYMGKEEGLRDAAHEARRRRARELLELERGEAGHA